MTAAAYERDDRWRLFRLTATVAGATLLYVVLPLRNERWWVAAIVGVAAIGAIAPLTGRRLRAVATAQRPVLVAMEAFVQLVVLVVYGFSAVYLALAQRAGQFDGLETRIDAVYFTVTTLSTVGFGDITATGQTARVVVTLQVLFDVTLFAVAVRLLGGTARARRASRDG